MVSDAPYAYMWEARSRDGYRIPHNSWSLAWVAFPRLLNYKPIGRTDAISRPRTNGRTRFHDVPNQTKPRKHFLLLLLGIEFFGMADSNNNINVLHRSPVSNRLMESRAPHVSYKINGNVYASHIILLMAFVLTEPHLWRLSIIQIRKSKEVC
jgi:hypothetical protein